MKMKSTIVLVFVLCLPFLIRAQRPAYCDDLPVVYEKGASANGARPKLPEFATQPVIEYKVQVAILKFSHPKDHTFHPKLVARYRPCEEVWVVESRESFTDRKDAEKLRQELIKAGYKGAYITDLLGYY